MKMWQKLQYLIGDQGSRPTELGLIIGQNRPSTMDLVATIRLSDIEKRS